VCEKAISKSVHACMYVAGKEDILVHYCPLL